MATWVYLKLQPFRQLSICAHGNMKSAPKILWTIRVLEQVGKVAYKFDLPVGTPLHLVFHVSQLKKQLGQRVHGMLKLLQISNVGEVVLEPQCIIDFHWLKSGRKVTQEALV